MIKVRVSMFGNETELELLRAVYENGRLALMLTEEGLPFATLTVNLPEQPLNDGEFFVKTWSENTDVVKEIMKSGLFVDTGKVAPTGFVTAEVWKFSDPDTINNLRDASIGVRR